MKIKLWSVGAVAAAMLWVGCEQKATTEQSGTSPTAQIDQAQQRSTEALEKAKQAQEQAATEQQDVQSAREQAQSARQEVQKAEQELQAERQQAQQAQQQAQQETQSAQQEAQQAQQQAITAQQQAEQQQEQQRQQELQAQQQQQAQQEQQAQQQAQQQPPAIGGAGAAQGQQSLSGTIVSVQQDSVQVNVPEQGPVRLEVDSAVPVMVDGQQATLTELEPGQEVRASFSMEGENRKASRIDATGGAATGGSGEQPMPAQEPAPTGETY